MKILKEFIRKTFNIITAPVWHGWHGHSATGNLATGNLATKGSGSRHLAAGNLAKLAHYSRQDESC